MKHNDNVTKSITPRWPQKPCNCMLMWLLAQLSVWAQRRSDSAVVSNEICWDIFTFQRFSCERKNGAWSALNQRRHYELQQLEPVVRRRCVECVDSKWRISEWQWYLRGTFDFVPHCTSLQLHEIRYRPRGASLIPFRFNIGFCPLVKVNATFSIL